MTPDRGRTWPPPGLERLRGVLPAAGRRGMAATVLAGPALLWITTSDRSVIEGPAGLLLTVLLLLGLFLYLGAVLRAAAALDLARRGRRLGYPPAIVLDALADTAADTGALVDGSGEYAEVRPRIRDTMRRLRRAAAFAAALAGLLPLPLLCLGILLALRGAAAPGSVALLLLLPLLLAGIAALLLRGYAALLAQWEKGASAWDPSPVSERERVAEWLGASEAAPSGTTGPSAGLLSVLAVAAGGVLCFVLLFVTVGGMGALAGWSARPPRSRIAEDPLSLAFVELRRPLRIPVDSALPRADADAAYHAFLSAAGDARPRMRRPARTWPPLWDGERPPPLDYRLVWRMVLGDATTPPVPEWRDLAEHPALAELAVLARTPALDPIGARWAEVPPPTEFGGFLERTPALRLAVLRPVRDAALAVRSGRPARARAILQDLLSAGFLLVDHGRTPAELHLGRLMVEAGSALLLQLDPDPGQSVVGDVIDRILRRTPMHSASDGASTEALRRRALAADLYPAFRWDAWRQLRQRLRCGAPGALLFGESARLRAMEAQVLPALLLTPGDSLAARAFLQPPPGSLEGASRRTRRIVRAAELAGGRALLRNPCFGAFSREF